MFLTELQTEEKYAFLELASMLARVDGYLSIYESSIIEKYQKELEIKNYHFKDRALGDILKVFKSERSKNIVLTEILQLIFADGVFHDNERESVRLIKEHFGFNSNEYGSFKDWILKIKDLKTKKQQKI